MSLAADVDFLRLARAPALLAESRARTGRRRAAWQAARPEAMQKRLARILESTAWPVLDALRDWVYRRAS
ncbi:MAG TPA: hypothetical protein VHN99_11895 [Deinococcales bacterium]|nr:hypothetical protein [Deinococcales bacterium]